MSEVTLVDIVLPGTFAVKKQFYHEGDIVSLPEEEAIILKEQIANWEAKKLKKIEKTEVLRKRNLGGQLSESVNNLENIQTIIDEAVETATAPLKEKVKKLSKKIAEAEEEKSKK